ncbi:TolC family protein [Gemmata sp. JC673]|uniref:TolC family protein n=1 Tax=Gemmata algarum TaxID=2975278 RepID=A0ABU5F2P2_9BACT|nr:TolC family protein [Gemmata algarum]MDY3561087.1 TolC family protein [Gemmata algarum]
MLPTTVIGWAIATTLSGCAIPSRNHDETNSGPAPVVSARRTLGGAQAPSREPSSTLARSGQPPSRSRDTVEIEQAGFRATPAKPLPPPKQLPSSPDEEPVRANLDQIINAMLLNDAKLRAGFESINQANADALTASLRPNPSLFTDGQLLPLTRPFTVDRQGGPPQQDAQITYPIDWYLFGKRAANMAVAAHGVKVSEADFEDTVRQRVAEAATGYYDLLEAHALLALARQDVANLEKVEAALDRAVEAGGKTRVELNRLRLDLAQSRRLVRDAETSVVSAKAKLRALLGRTDADPAFDVAGSLDAPLNALLPPPEDGFEVALKNRPDLNALRWKAVQARASVTAEERKAYPEVSPMVGYTRQYQRKAIGFPDADSWTAAATITLPVFDRNQGNRAKAISVVSQNAFQYQASVVAVRAEVETAAREYRAARATAEDIAADQLKLAREVLDAITTAYQAGGRPLVDLLDAERNFRDTYRAYVTSRAAYWRAVYRYRSAIGQQTTR